MAKLSQIRRLAILINKLSAVRYVPTDALIAHVENTLALYDNKDSNYSQRTMQRDFGLIDEMFGIVIRNDKSRGYYIAELDEMTDNYKELLLNFELLSSINTDSILQKYVLAEHRRNAIRHELIAPLLKAIRKRNPIEFDYTLVRHNGKIVHKRLMPHFLKESQYRWYLIGYDTDGKLKSFGVDRISAINILEDTQFLRDEHIDIPSLFRDSYGIGHWGGRYIWQIKNSGNLLLCWKPTPDEDPEAIETALIARFKEQHGGHRPFANLKD